ncbi:MAG: hypothetical protein AAF437_01010 [Pseudomonadota bacterium]
MADGMALAASPADVKSTKSRAKTKRRKVKVDFWATDLNTAEIGIMKRTQNEAASDQFTKDMELYGQTVVDGKREALIGYRQELWDASEGFDRRLVIKLFSESLGWRGSAEMMLGRSLQLSLSAGGEALPVFSINLARHDQLIQLERVASKWPFMPERFSFFIQNKTEVKFYTLRRHLFCIGADYSLFDQKGRKIGVLDHQLFNLGGAWMMRIDPDFRDRKLEAVLELICAVLKFNGAGRKHVKKLSEQVLRGKLKADLDHDEEDLYRNPRRR